NILSQTVQYDSLGTYISYDETVFTYDANNNALTKTTLQWQNSSWFPNGKDTYTYDAGNHATSDLMQYTDSLGHFITYQMVDYTYDVNFNKIVERYHPADSAQDSQDSIRYYYNNVTVTGVNQLSDIGADISVYPNPASNTLTIANYNTGTPHLILSVYDISGRVVTSQQITGNTSYLNVKNFAPGFYQLLFEDGKGNRAVKRVEVK
ncbi:MAG: hypothetical protein JWO06_1267, partial [Bacteroidota bacterium]|nr:hypothetical protein [Bacteroidota bacterium]